MGIMVRTTIAVVAGAALGALTASMLFGSGRAVDSPAVSHSTEWLPTTFEREPETQSRETDSPAASEALAQLSDIDDPLSRRNAALALLDVFGNDPAGIARIASALPREDAINFTIDAIVKRAGHDTHGAIAAALALPELAQRRLALTRLASELAYTDPFDAIAHIDEIGVPALQSEFMASLLDAWAMIDPLRLFEYLETADRSRVPVTDTAFEALAVWDAGRLLAIAEGLRRDARTVAVTAAIEALIDTDAAAARAGIDALRAGTTKNTLRRNAARAYGQQDPEAAWRWVHEQGMPSAVRGEVIAGILSVDADRALDLMMADLTGADARLRREMAWQVGTFLAALSRAGSPQQVMFALDSMLGLEERAIDADIERFVSVWSVHDPESAVRWSLANLDRLDPNRTLPSLAIHLARTSLDLARQTVLQLQDTDRLPWIAGIGRELAQSDLADARDWAFEFPRGSMRDTALIEYVKAEADGGSIDMWIFDQFSDDAPRETAASAVIPRLACDGHTALAQRIAATQITDALLRRQMDQQIENPGTPPFSCFRISAL